MMPSSANFPEDSLILILARIPKLGSIISTVPTTLHLLVLASVTVTL